MMVLKWTILGFTILGACLSIIVFSILKNAQPVLDGEIEISGLILSVRVIRDVYAIPHIYAKNSQDLYLAQGYVTSQDRLWQMDFSRRIAHGRLSEIFGERTLEIDLFLRALELTDMAKKFYDDLHNDTN
ncbi:MAG: penicillin acylase family protein [Thermodesulfobacteriota bacterium]